MLATVFTALPDVPRPSLHAREAETHQTRLHTHAAERKYAREPPKKKGSAEK